MSTPTILLHLLEVRKPCFVRPPDNFTRDRWQNSNQDPTEVRDEVVYRNDISCTALSRLVVSHQVLHTGLTFFD
jgi:hypothetical protein